MFDKKHKTNVAIVPENFLKNNNVIFKSLSKIGDKNPQNGYNHLLIYNYVQNSHSIVVIISIKLLVR